MSRAAPSDAGRRTAILGAGGRVVLLTLVLVAAVVAWRMVGILRTHGGRGVGDGRNVESYGFDLSTCLVRRDLIVAAGIPKDGIPALDLPRVLLPEQVDSLARRWRSRLLVDDDRVIGVVLAGSARAYPVRFMNWHEVVNDTLAGHPIAVTYAPLCDAVVVFNRRGPDGAARRFGVSGLLYNSNLLMYDSRPGGMGESLWSQLQARAIAGPAAAAEERLPILPVAVATWEDWRTRHPRTTVLAPVPALAEEYRRNPYSSYFGSEQLRFPVDPQPPAADGLTLKTPVVIVRAGSDLGVFPLPLIASMADKDGLWTRDLGGTRIRFAYRRDPPGAIVEPVAGDRGAEGSAARPLEIVYCCWFAWYATHPESRSPVRVES